MLSELYPFAWNQYLDITGILLRLLGLFLLAPAFNHRSISVAIKIVLAFSLSLALFPVVRPWLGTFPTDLYGIVTLAMRETVIGLFLGCLLYTSPSPRDLSTSRMPSSA